MSQYIVEPNVVNEVTELTSNILSNLLNEWNIMFTVTSEFKTQRLNQFVSHLKDFYNEMLVCEEKRKNNYLKEVEKKLKQCKELEEALSVSIDNEISCTQTPLTESIKKLDNTLKKFESLKVERMSRLEGLRQKERELCTLMGFENLHLQHNIPTMEDIEKLEHYIFVLEEEKIKRMDQFLKCRNNIVQSIAELEISVLLDFEQSLMEQETVLSLTSQDLDRIRDVEASYKQQLDAAKEKVEYLYEKVRKLWDKLDIDDDYRTAFMEKHSGVGRKTTEYIQHEIHRCEKLKMELVEPLIKKTRRQILEIYNKLCFSEEQKLLCAGNETNHFSEDLLDYLEIELGKLEYLYNENSDILEVVKRQRNMWERMLELEEAAKDKQRLFNNRGGQLLREEKERKTIEQNLPKLTRRLEDLLVDYEDRKQKPFLYYGENLLEKIRLEIEQHNANKQSKNVVKKNETKLLDSASKISEKRKINGLLTPKSDNVKRLRLAASTTSLASSASKSSTKSSNKSVDGRWKSRSRIALFKDQDTSVASSYSIFQEEIEEKKRSTTLSTSGRQPLKEVNSPVPLFHSSPSQDIKTPRFNFRPRAAEFSSKSAIPTPKMTTPSSKHMFVTPKTVTRSVTRTATPKFVSVHARNTPGKTPTPKPRQFFDTPKSGVKSTQKSLSIIKPAKFKFDL